MNSILVLNNPLGVILTSNKLSKPIQTYFKLRGAYDKFPDFFRMSTFIDSTHMKLYSPSK